MTAEGNAPGGMGQWRIFMSACVVCGQPANLEYNGQAYCQVCIETVTAPCLVYSRIVGYLTPVVGWNAGKAQEFKDRKMFNAGVVLDGQRARP
jgi:ribonucleoside-triphosphate reductase